MAAVMNNTAGQALHSAGLFADTALNGPQIGELVLVVDRAKNLPNRKTMGKQDPYCAARFGKEAKKTAADRRGGQTPRWNQEIKFNVYDSVDHHQIKISLFNDDKKTDLIGEKMVSLDHILNRGGGQSDDWHTLQCKGKYAGEILIEFTFYDHRPREEKPKQSHRDRKQSTTASHNQSPSTTGPRPEPAVKRRPLPTDPGRVLQQRDEDFGSPQASTLPQLPDQDHIPYSQRDLYPAYSTLPEPTQYEDFTQDPHPAPLAPLPRTLPNNPPSHPSTGASFAPTTSYMAPTQPPPFKNFDDNYYSPNTQNDFAAAPDFIDPYSNGPYGFEARPYELLQHQQSSRITPPRNDRVEALSTSPSKRPQYELHTHSDPSFGPQQRVSHVQQRDYQHEYNSSNSPMDASHTPQAVKYGNMGFNSQPTSPVGYGAVEEENSYNPPPAPIHRNSAPTIPPSAQPQHPQFSHQHQHQHQPHRPFAAPSMHSFTQPYQNGVDQRRSYQSMPRTGPTRPLPHSDYSVKPRDRRMTEESSRPSYAPPRRSSYSEQEHSGYEHFDNYSSGGSSYHHYSSSEQPAPNRISQSNGSSRLPEYLQARPFSLMESTTNQYQVIPRAEEFSHHKDVSPSTQGITGSPVDARMTQRILPQVSRKSVSPQATQSTKRSSVPFSPDSYNDLNPNSTRAHPAQTASKEPSPMYGSQPSDTTTSPQTTTSSKLNNGPIVRTDGAVIDPSDHLPGHTWAPEPESTGKQKRPSTVVNIKRFGPRDAPPTPISIHTPSSAKSLPRTPDSGTNLSGGNRSQRRTPSGSPLTPTMPATLNAVTNSPYPPPVPAKIPLNGSRSGIEDYEPGGSMASLSQELRSIDIGPSKASAVSFQRVRKSRFGA